jgi:hypothetical protein
MKEKIKDFGSMILGAGIFIGFILLLLILLKGGLWLSVVLYPWLAGISAITLIITVLILLPLLIFKKTREFSVTGLMIASCIFGTTTWVWSLLLAYFFWGFMGLFIGLSLAGVGVVPIAMLAVIFNGEWSTLWELIFLVILTFGVRFLSVYMATKLDE